MISVAGELILEGVRYQELAKLNVSKLQIAYSQQVTHIKSKVKSKK